MTIDDRLALVIGRLIIANEQGAVRNEALAAELATRPPAPTPTADDSSSDRPAG
jgi:hypothetical protein